MTEPTFDKLYDSNVFLVIGTTNYLREMRLPGPLAEHRKMALALRKPVLLMIERSLTDREKSKLRDLYSEFGLVREIEFDKNALRATDDKLVQAMKELVGWERLDERSQEVKDGNDIR